MRKIVSSSLVALLAPLPIDLAHAQPGCDAVISPTAIGLALNSQSPRDAVRAVATESFGIAPSAQGFFVPLIDAAYAQHPNDPAALAAAIARALGGICAAFGGGGAPPQPPAMAALPVTTTPTPPESGQKMVDDLLRNEQRSSARGKNIAATEGTPSGDTPPTEPPAQNAGDGSNKNPPAGDADSSTRRTMVSDLSQSELRKNLVASYQTYEKIKDAFERKDPEVSKAQVDEAADALERIEQNALLTLPNYGLYIGPSFVQDSEGGFDPRAEFYARFDSGRMHYDVCTLVKPGSAPCSGEDAAIDGWFRGFFDVDYVTKDLNEDAETPAETPAALVADPLDVLGRDNGRIRVDAGLQWHPFAFATDLVGFAAGVGLTAPQEDGDDSREEGLRRGRTRWFAGLHSQTTYRFGVGELFLGVGKDQFYDIRCSAENTPLGCGDFSKRYLAEGTFALANDKATDWSLVGKVSADFPRDHDGESDVTISVLLRKDLDGFLTGLAKDD